ncbi:MAG: hypothetical protein ACTSUQ_01645 [Candidatus Freyarchaeota archaeon]
MRRNTYDRVENQNSRGLEEEDGKIRSRLVPAIRRMIRREVQNLTEIEGIVSGSGMTEEDALELGEKVSKSIAERFRKHATGD